MLFKGANMAKSKLTEEQKKARKREAEKTRRERIRNDPELRKKQQEKQRLLNQKKFQKGQLKLVANMSAREHRLKKKQWRVASNRYYENQKHQNEEVEARGEITPSTSAALSTPTESVQQNFLRDLGRKRRMRNRAKIVQENCKLKSRIVDLERKINTLRHRVYRQNEATNSSTSPRAVIKNLMKTGNKTTIQKKLLFGEVLKKNLSTGYKELKTNAHKFLIRKLLSRNSKVMKKYRLLNQYNCITSKIVPQKQRKITTTRPSIQDLRVKKITTAIRQSITHFFERDDISRMCPGKKDCKTMKKVKKQKRLLLGSLKSLYQKFCESNETFKISYSSFCKLKPFWVVMPKVNDRETCACKICTNMELLTKALHTVGAINKSDPKEIAEYLCCDWDSIACLQRKCASCIDLVIPYNDFTDKVASISYAQWITKKEEITSRGVKKIVTHTTKEEVNSTLVDSVSVFDTEIKKYMHHIGIYLHQVREINHLKKRLELNEVLIHCDFSENYEGKFGTEIQSYHFGGSRKQFTLHTVEVYYRKDAYSEVRNKSLCTLSESLDHSAPAIWAHLQHIFDYLKKNCTRIDVVHFLSDSPSTQYRNKTIFYLIAHGLKFIVPTLKIATWNYSAPGHGKGAPDGIGGTLKRIADDLVAQGVDLASFANFVTTLQTFTRNIQLYVVEASEIMAVADLLPSKANQPVFKGTMQVHQIVYSEKAPHQLLMKSLSCLKCVQCQKFTLGILSYERTIEDSDPDKPGEQETTASFPLEVVLDVNDVTSKPECIGTIDDAVLKPGVYILAKFDGRKNNHYKYVCRIIKELTVQGFRSFNQSKKEFVLREKDVCQIERNDILEILPVPESKVVKRKTVFVFPRAVDINETS